MQPGDKFLHGDDLYVYHKKHYVKPYPRSEIQEPQHVAYRLRDGKMDTWTGDEEFYTDTTKTRIEYDGYTTVEFCDVKKGDPVGAHFMKISDSEIIDLNDGEVIKWTRPNISQYQEFRIYVERS